MAQALIEIKKLRSNQCKFCSNPCIEETSCISCNPTDNEKWTIGVVEHIQLIGNNVKNSKNDDGNKKENRKKISTKTKKSKLSKSTESYYHNGCFYDDINVIVDEIEVQSRKIEQTKEHQEESHKKLSESIDVIVFEKELNENKEIEGNDVNDKNHQKEADAKIMHKKVCQGCGETFVGTNEEELNKRFWKVHWDDQNPFITECQFCENIYHGNDQDSVNKRVLEHKKICKGNNEK